MASSPGIVLHQPCPEGLPASLPRPLPGAADPCPTAVTFAAAAVPLTSVRQPRHELGVTAARLLLEEAAADSEHEHRRVLFTAELIVRSSTMTAR